MSIKMFKATPPKWERKNHEVKRGKKTCTSRTRGGVRQRREAFVGVL